MTWILMEQNVRSTLISERAIRAEISQDNSVFPRRWRSDHDGSRGAELPSVSVIVIPRCLNPLRTCQPKVLVCYSCASNRVLRISLHSFRRFGLMMKGLLKPEPE